MTTREIKNMGKAKKMKVSKSGGESDTFQPLTEQILTDKTVKISGRTKNRTRKEDDDSVNIVFTDLSSDLDCVLTPH
jgi:hypothetical protein